MSLAPANVDLRAFNKMCHQISSITGSEFQRVVEYEAAKVLEGSASRTKAAGVANIKFRAGNAKMAACAVGEYQPAPSKFAQEKKASPHVVNGKVLYWLGNRYPDALWKLISDRRSRGLKARLGARGLAKQSWNALSKTFGVQIKLPAYAANAIPSNGKTYPGNTRSNRTSSVGAFVLHVVNAQPGANSYGSGGRAAFRSAIAGRAKYFERNLTHKVFESAAAIAKKYPGMKVA